VPFRDRVDAGRRLGAAVAQLGLPDPLVFGMARGGLVVAAQVAGVLGAPFDVLVVRKIGHPQQPELALGAIGEGGARVLNDALVEQLGVSAAVIEDVVARETVELERRLQAYRRGRPALEATGRNVVVVDDGLATGATARVAVAVVRGQGANRVVLGVPVAPPGALAALDTVADDVVCVEVSENFSGLSQWYDDFRQVDDDEVRALLAEGHAADD
jgi:putative phosphoribosyl transferase